jgi:aldehyde:ferredoxin oxidoreductase
VYPCGGTKITTLKDVIALATGWNVTVDELMKTGERIFNLCRAFNAREGITKKDDALPRRFSEPLIEGTYKGEALSDSATSKMLSDFYGFRGWNRRTGVPTKKKLEELELGYAAKQLESIGVLPRRAR